MPFEKGQSGNPGGRPADVGIVKSLARQNTEKALRRLVEWIDSDNPKASVSACNAILDRGWGKPNQTTDVSVDAAAGLLGVLAGLKK